MTKHTALRVDKDGYEYMRLEYDFHQLRKCPLWLVIVAYNMRTWPTKSIINTANELYPGVTDSCVLLKRAEELLRYFNIPMARWRVL